MCLHKTFQFLIAFLVGTMLSPAFANPGKIKHRSLHVKDGYQLAAPPNLLNPRDLPDDEDHCSKYPCYNETEIEFLPDAHEELHQNYLAKRDGQRKIAPKGWTSAGNFRTQVLKYHNAYRASHGAPPLKWSTSLAAYALAHARTCDFHHSKPYKYGENLAGGTMDNPVFYVWLWYKEIKLYNYKNPGWADATGHFTQVIWKDSNALGCAFVTGCPTGLPQMILCEYTPNGNISPAYWYNLNVAPLRPSPPIPAIPPKYTEKSRNHK